MAGRHAPSTVPCTKSEASPVCQLVRRIREYNELLWGIGLEIREENGLGEMVVAIPLGTGPMYPWEDEQVEGESPATLLLGNIFAHHHCIVAVELTAGVARNRLLLSLLQEKRSVRKLTISDVPYCEADVLEALVKLVSRSNRNGSEVPGKYFCSAVRPPLLPVPQEQGSMYLTALDVADLDMSSVCAGQFIDTLLQNDTITDLTVGTCVFTYGCGDLLYGFATYLKKEGSTLKKLTVRTPEASRRALVSLVKAIASTTTLNEVVVDIDVYEVQDKALFAEILDQNRTLRALSVTWERNSVVANILYGVQHLGGEAPIRIEPWLSALPENTTLSALTVDLFGFSEEECNAFFRALALNETLEKVHISQLPTCADLKQICQIIRSSRLANTVHIDDHHVSIRSLSALPDCQEVTSLIISSFHLHNLEIMGKAFETLPSCSHVTSLRVCVQYCFLNSIRAAMAAYILEARALKDIQVHVYVDIHEREGQKQDPAAEQLLVKALTSNPSVTRMAVKELPLSDENARLLAKAVVNSKSLSEVSLAMLSRDANNVMLQTLVSGIGRNRCLLRVELPSCKGRDAELVVIRNVTRRNASVVARAARFVMGDCDPYNARAVELVSGHERVLSIVQEQAGVGAAEAAAMVKRALNLRCLTGLDEYMRLTGVVKRRVVCTGRRGYVMQLDELSYDCWLHIRKYLTVADVVGAD